MKIHSHYVKIFLVLLLFKTDAVFASIEQAGDITQIALPITAVGATYFYKDFTGFKEFAYAGLSTLVTVQVLKNTIHRERPNGHDKSFPSGHTAAAFVGAGFLQMRYGWNYGIPAYLVAAFTGYSRIASRMHWTTDVLAGAAIGIGANLLFTTPFAKEIQISPYTDVKKKETGIVVSMAI